MENSILNFTKWRDYNRMWLVEITFNKMPSYDFLRMLTNNSCIYYKEQFVLEKCIYKIWVYDRQETRRIKKFLKESDNVWTFKKRRVWVDVLDTMTRTF